MMSSRVMDQSDLSCFPFHCLRYRTRYFYPSYGRILFLGCLTIFLFAVVLLSRLRRRRIGQDSVSEIPGFLHPLTNYHLVSVNLALSSSPLYPLYLPLSLVIYHESVR